MATNSAIARRLAAQTWGEVQYQRKLGPGIWLFETAGHGGYVVDTDIRPVFRGEEADVLIRANGHYLNLSEQHFAVFEEDCEYAKVEWLCPDIFKRLSKLYEISCPFEEWITQRRTTIRKSLERWNPEWLEKHPNPTTLQEDFSHENRKSCKQQAV